MDFAPRFKPKRISLTLSPTTKEFLRYFGVNDLSDLPKLKEIEEILKENEDVPELADARDLIKLKEDSKDPENAAQ